MCNDLEAKLLGQKVWRLYQIFCNLFPSPFSSPWPEDCLCVKDVQWPHKFFKSKHIYSIQFIYWQLIQKKILLWKSFSRPFNIPPYQILLHFFTNCLPKCKGMCNNLELWFCGKFQGHRLSWTIVFFFFTFSSFQVYSNKVHKFRINENLLVF